MPGTEILPAPKIDSKTNHKICPRWHVILLNDDYHSVQFVVLLLMKIFKKDFEEAKHITWMIHTSGRGIAETCSKERAGLYLEQIASMKEGPKGALSAEIEPAE